MLTLVAKKPTKSDRPAIGEVIRQLRQARGLSQAAVAKRAGLHTNTVAFIERGERGTQITWETVEAIARGLDLTMSERDALLADAGYDPERADYLRRLISERQDLDDVTKRALMTVLDMEDALRRQQDGIN